MPDSSWFIHGIHEETQQRTPVTIHLFFLSSITTLASTFCVYLQVEVRPYATSENVIPRSILGPRV
ncbi:MAG: hypothetical protein J2P41_10340, partial [Blastocatellia bacterium]|nr:hypothetical protein [Blastocatellia bacterium]